jgi:radical SAM-linked protein
MPPAGEVPTGREYIGRWENALLDSGLPVLLLGTGRPRIALGAPLPSGSSAERELVEFWLTRTLPAWAIREPLSSHLPTSHRAVDLENVWIGAPALSGQVAAADYSVSVSGDVSLGAADAAAARLLERNHVPRKRQKGGETRTYDLRPLLERLLVDGVADGELRLRMRTRLHPERGTGRPDEVVAALGDELGTELRIGQTVRERLLLADEVDAPFD